MKQFKFIRNLFVIIACCLCFAMCKQAKEQHYASLVFKNLPFVETSINGTEAWLLIDTGASLSMIDSTFAVQSGFNIEQNKTSSSIRHVIGTSNLQYYTNTEITINNVATHITFYVQDIDMLLSQLSKQLNKKVVGILGCDYLANTGALIDMQSKKLYIVRDKDISMQKIVNDSCLVDSTIINDVTVEQLE